MSDNLSSIMRAFRYLVILFVVIFFQSIIANSFIYIDFDQFVGNYLSIYQGAVEFLRSNGLPMWSSNIFLGGNFLSLQNSYSIYSPFFLITLLFPSSVLSELFLPLLFLKTLLAGGALYLYMKETGWFSPLTTGIALALYLFNGWQFSYLNQFIFLELLIYIPFALFGIEYLLARGYRRYFVIAVTLLLISHFSFTLLFSPILFLYWWVRLTYLNKEKIIDFNKQIRWFIFGVFTLIGVNFIFIFPMILAGNTLRLTVESSLNYEAILSTLMQTFTPSFHQNYLGKLSFISFDSLALFQSALVFLLLPQFIKLIPKQARLTVIMSYSVLLGIVLVTQTVQIFNIAGIAPFNLNVLSILFLLFNALMVAYMLRDDHHLDRPLLKATGRYYKLVITLLTGLAFWHEIQVGNEGFWQQLFAFSPYLFVYILLLIFIDVFQFLLNLMAHDHRGLRIKSLAVIIVIECFFVSYIYLGSHNHKIAGVQQALADQFYIRNNTVAISNYLRAIDTEASRLINSSQIYANEPLQNDYSGFSIRNIHLVNEDFLWMVEDGDQQGAKIQNYFLTTALGAKYYLTEDSVGNIPGYEYVDRSQGITIYQNKYFATLGMTSQSYILNSNFQALTDEQKPYVFLQTVILADEEAPELVEKFNLMPFDLHSIPDIIEEIQYFEAAQFRQTLGIDGIVETKNSISHSYSATDATLLVYTIPYERGWRATVNGEDLVIRELNQGFIGVEIPEAGEFEIVLRYRTPGIVTGMVVTGVMLFLIIGHFAKPREEDLVDES